MRLALLGQSLIRHDLRTIDWSDRLALRGILSRSDVVFTDLEVALEGAGAPTREGSFLHTAPVAVLDCLRDLGVGLLGLANNHAWDLGSEGLIAARRRVASGGFGFAGTGATIVEAFAPGFVATAQGTVGLVCAAAGKIRPGATATETGPGVAELRVTPSGVPHADDRARFLSAIRSAADQADAVIACLHNHLWETDPSATPGWQRELARDCIDHGASVFVGHGTPQLQGIERHEERPILHGLGSFIFQSVTRPGHYTHAAWQGLIVEFDTVSSEIVLSPLVLNEAGVGPTRGIPALAQGEERAAILDLVVSLSRRLASVPAE